MQYNGGPVLTHALLSGSRAIDQGKNLSGAPTDARGFPRTWDDPAIVNAEGGDGTDIGAYELYDFQITKISKAGADLRLSFNSFAGRNYALQSRADLGSGLWSPVPGTISATGSVTQVTVTNAVVQPWHFYRVHRVP